MKPGTCNLSTVSTYTYLYTRQVMEKGTYLLIITYGKEPTGSSVHQSHSTHQ